MRRSFCIKSIQQEMMVKNSCKKRFESVGVYIDDEGMLRCRGRIGKANIRFETRFPILLPSHNHVTELIILNAHEKIFHNGVKATLAEVRSTFWIVKGRQYIKKILRKCILCRRLEGLRILHQLQPSYPNSELMEELHSRQ